MFSPRFIAGLALLAAWASLVLWQLHEYGHECDAAQEMLRRQGESVMNALVGGIQSHRRMGPFFEEQIKGVLEGLAKSPDVLTVGIFTPGGQPLLWAGNTSLLELTPPLEAGEALLAGGFRLAVTFPLLPRAGGGRGWGHGPGWNAEDDTGPFASGGQFVAVLLLNRTRIDEYMNRAAWSRVTVVAAGSLVLLCVGLVWRTTMRLTTARANLQAESRHLQELNQAAAGLAHETRNPLGLIRGWTQQLIKSGLNPAEQQQAQAIVEECDRVTARINQFLTFARPLDARMEAVDLAKLLAELTFLLEPDLEAKNLQLRQTLPRGMILVQADKEMLRQALFNLMQNALQWSPSAGQVEIELRLGHNDRYRIEVADRGPGVPEKARPSLFTPYYTTRPGGTGLGLAIVRRLALTHGWQVGFTPRPQGGSIFWLDGIHG